MSLKQIDDQCKNHFFQMVNTYGPNFIGKYNISEDEIRTALDRRRSTQEMWASVENFFKLKGYHISRTSFGLQLELEARTMASSPDDQFKLATAIEAFRLRATLQGDVDNM